MTIKSNYNATITSYRRRELVDSPDQYLVNMAGRWDNNVAGNVGEWGCGAMKPGGNLLKFSAGGEVRPILVKAKKGGQTSFLLQRIFWHNPDYSETGVTIKSYNETTSSYTTELEEHFGTEAKKGRRRKGVKHRFYYSGSFGTTPTILRRA